MNFEDRKLICRVLDWLSYYSRGIVFEWLYTKFETDEYIDYLIKKEKSFSN